MHRLWIPALLAALALAGCGRSASTGTLEGALFPPTEPVHDFVLPDQDGAAVSLASLRGHVVVLTFLDAVNRSDSVVLADQIRGALGLLGEPARELPVLAVSVDPARDTAAAARAFLSATGLSGRMSFLVGSPGQLTAVWKQYAIAPQTASDPVHNENSSEEVYLLDRGGRVREGYPIAVLTPGLLAHDIRVLQAG
ncbi:MAG TPA: SCO family protein [Solirubrobacteraceae bacterium]|jgi:protein SCO1/2|nr:SCO family protein [Solirubrobacteraceae bacterium]